MLTVRLLAVVVAGVALNPMSPRGAATEAGGAAEPITAIYQVVNSLDDVTEVSGAIEEFNSAIWVGTGGSASSSYTGLRFRLDIPKGSVISAAYLEVNAASSQWLNIGMTMGIENGPSLAPFSIEAPPSARPLAPGLVPHASNSLWVANTWYSLAEVGPLLQLVVNHADWNETSSAAFVVRGTSGAWGRKFVHSLDGTPALAPRLVVTYTAAPLPPPPPPPPPPPSGFSNNKILVGFADPTSVTVVPDGRLIVTERAGRTRIVLPGRTNYEPVPFLQLTDSEAIVGERALVNLALDPDFATNGHYYVFYTRASTLRDTVSRFTAVGNTTNLTTELVLYEDSEPSSDIHHGGGLAFGSDGRLYIATGDGHDTMPGTAHASQRLTSSRGKILRINRDGSIPEDNPFHDGVGPNLDAIWALGLRNPFRLSIDAATGVIHAYDVGGGAWEEVNVVSRSANYGWPICEGGCTTPGMTGPLFAYSHAGRDAAIGGGVVYRGAAFPPSHQGNLFFGDYVQSWIRRVVFAADGSVADNLPFDPPDGAPDGPTGQVVDLDVGVDGAIYYVNIGGGSVHRISYYSGNRPPVIAAVSGTPTIGQGAPLPVQFSVEADDPDGQPITYRWEFGDGGTSTELNPLHVYQSTGTFVARVLVSDGIDTTFSDPIEIRIGSAPVADIIEPAEGTTFGAGDPIAFAGTATDDEPLTDAAFSWLVVFHHDTHTHPAFGPVTGPTGSFTIPTTGHDFSGDTWYELVLTVRDGQGLTSIVSRTIRPRKVDLTLASSPPGLTLSLDAITRPAPLVHDTLAGFTHRVTAPGSQQLGGATYEFVEWSDGGAADHDIAAPAAAATLVATYRTVPTLAVADATVTEGDAGPAVLSFAVSLASPSDASVTVAYATADGTASGTSDFQPAAGTIVFAPGQLSASVAVTVSGDTDPEADEQLTLSLSAPVGALLGDGEALGTIVNDDFVPIVITVGDLSIAEGTGGVKAVSLPVTLSASSSRQVTVHYATAPGTAAAADDFTPATGTLIFAPGTTQMTVVVNLVTDALDEADETFALTLSNSLNATIGDGDGVVSIVDDDLPPSMAVADLSIAEGGGAALVMLSLSAASGRTVTVNAATSPLSAGLQDYIATSTVVSWAQGQLTATVSVPIVGDVIDEPNETFAVTLSGAVDATVADAAAVVTIVDDDAAPTLSVSDVSVAEGATGTAPAVFTVTLTGLSSHAVGVAFATAPLTATAGTDFTATAGTLTFAPGVSTQTIAVPVVGDATWEPDETFAVNLSAATNATLADAQGIGTIANDDPVPPGPLTATFRVVAGADDVNEAGTDFQPAVSTAWLGNGGTATTSYAGLRFTGVDLPRGATIVSARLEVNSAQTQWISLQYELGIEATGNSAPLTATARPSARLLATPRVTHASNLQWTTGTWYGVDGLGPLVQAVTSRADWTPLGSVTLVLRGTGSTWGRKFVRSYEAGAATAARLIVVYHPPAP